LALILKAHIRTDKNGFKYFENGICITLSTDQNKILDAEASLQDNFKGKL
jgi:hypothetical protein